VKTEVASAGVPCDDADVPNANDPSKQKEVLMNSVSAIAWCYDSEMFDEAPLPTE
jgi:hypothetical protein